MRIKSWKARESQLGVRVGAKRECLSQWVARLQHGRIDDDAEDERDEERGLVRLLLSSVQCKPWSISVDETDRT